MVPHSKLTPLEKLEDFFLSVDGIISTDQFHDFIDHSNLSLTSGLKKKLIYQDDNVIYKPLLDSEKNIAQAVKTLFDSRVSEENLPDEIDHFIANYSPPKHKSALNASMDRKRFDVLREMLTCPSRLVVLRGAPGSTKSTLARYAVAILKANSEKKQRASATSQDFWILSTSHKAMAKFRDRANIYGTTLNRALYSNRKSTIPKGAVVVVDEAGLLGTLEMEALLKMAVKQAWKKVILLGDSRQETPKSAGQPLALIERDFPDLCFKLLISFRQKTDDMRQLVSDIYEGRGESAVAILKRLNALFFAAGRKALFNRAMKRYQTLITDQGIRQTQMITVDSEEAIYLNEALSALYRQAITEPQGLHREHNPAELLPGERVVLKRTAKGKDPQSGYLRTVRSGRMGVIEAIEPSRLIVSFDNQPDPLYVAFKPYNLSKFDRSYALSVREAQGLAMDHAVFIISKPINGQTMVSAGSRHRQSLQLVVNETIYDSIEKLADAISEFPHKPILIDLVQ